VGDTVILDTVLSNVLFIGKDITTVLSYWCQNIGLQIADGCYRGMKFPTQVTIVEMREEERLSGVLIRLEIKTLPIEEFRLTDPRIIFRDSNALINYFSNSITYSLVSQMPRFYNGIVKAPKTAVYVASSIATYWDLKEEPVGISTGTIKKLSSQEVKKLYEYTKPEILKKKWVIKEKGTICG